jgi:hypothetical protein
MIFYLKIKIISVIYVTFFDKKAGCHQTVRKQRLSAWIAKPPDFARKSGREAFRLRS